MKQLKSTWQIIFIVAFIVTIILLCLVDADKLKGFEGTLVAVNVGVAIFAINFSFIGYQLSAYRHLYRGVSTNQTLASVGVLFLGVLSYLVMGFSTRYAPVIALAVLPLLACSSLALLALAKRETNGEIVLNRLVSSERVQAFLDEFTQKAERDEDTLKKIALSKLQDTPMHEWDWHLSPRTEVDDPFDTLATIAAVAVKNDDLTTFEQCVETGLRRLDQTVSYTKSSGIHHRVKNHVQQALRRMWITVRECEKSGTFARKFQDLLARYVITKADASKQCSDETDFALSLMTSIALCALEDGARDLVLAPLVVTRQIIQKGVDQPLTSNKPIQDVPMEVLMFRHGLPQLSNTIKAIGHAAVEGKDTDILYRCFDAFGWLGCSAMKQDNHEVGKACLRGLCQLGRKSRAAKLECFYSRCALEPWQHAEERIGWILTWLPKLPTEAQENWIRSIEEAYSRLYGFEVKIKTEQRDGKPFFRINISKTAHTCGYSSWEGNRTVDYSDVTFLKDLELY
jgi:predicted transcriptional regulator